MDFVQAGGGTGGVLNQTSFQASGSSAIEISLPSKRIRLGLSSTIVSSDDACEIQRTLSADLVAMIDEVHAALLAGELVLGDPICNYPDTGSTWIEFDESLRQGYATACPPEGLAELDSRLAAAVWELGECRTSDDVTPSSHCKPAY